MGRSNNPDSYEQLMNESNRRAEKIARIQRFIAQDGGGADPSADNLGLEELFEEA